MQLARLSLPRRNMANRFGSCKEKGKIDAID